MNGLYTQIEKYCKKNFSETEKSKKRARLLLWRNVFSNKISESNKMFIALTNGSSERNKANIAGNKANIAGNKMLIAGNIENIALTNHKNAGNKMNIARIYPLQTLNLCYINGKIHRKEKIMSQNENPETPLETVETEKISDSVNNELQQKPTCHIHDSVEDWESDVIRKNLCRFAKITEHSDGKYYCLFHLPTKEKDIDVFEQKFREILKVVEETFAEAKKLPVERQKKAKEYNIYDFRYIWFPSNINLKNYNFIVAADFKSATFTEYADFESATFMSYANFESATFMSYAIFNSAIFIADGSFVSTAFRTSASFVSTVFKDFANFKLAIFTASVDFRSASFKVAYFASTVFKAYAKFLEAEFTLDSDFSSAHFMADVNFNSATFTANANFISAHFMADADFNLTTFTSRVDFSLAVIEEKSQMFFVKTIFAGNLSFKYINLKGYLAFEGKQNNRLFTGEKSLLDMQNARIADAKKVSFHTVRLEPNWFVNCDASKFFFTDCKWYYADEKDSESETANNLSNDSKWYYRSRNRLNVKKELEALKKREFENPNALLTKICWQLAENHEESKSFAKSSLFRKLANESRRLELRWFLQPFTLHWWYYAVSFYGENWRRAFFVLLGILLFSGAFYEWFGVFQMDNPQSMIGGEGFIHSLYVAALQRPEPKGSDNLTKLIVILETILAPLQAALLALAIRRKFMR